MNEISIFDFEQNSIRSLLIDDKPYFVGRDIAAALGYADTINALKRHCRGVAKRHLTDSVGREQEFSIIPESDLYRLIFNSKLPAAEKFENWVTETVLPSIRQTGAYALPEVSAAANVTSRFNDSYLAEAEFELRAIKELRNIFGREAARLAWMNSRLLPKPQYAVNQQNEGLEASCLGYLKQLTVNGLSLPQLVTQKNSDLLKTAGIDITGNKIALAASSKIINQHFAGTPWAGNWINTLLQLPEAEKPDKVKRFAGTASRYILIPDFYFLENANAENQI